MDSTSSTDNGSDSDNDSAAKDEDAQPTSTYIDPGCPLCGHTTFSSTEEGIPDGFNSHYVYVTCANCTTSFTIEYRAIDLFWYDGHDGQHSTVAHGLLLPTQTDYAEASGYAPLPDCTLLDRLDWPLHCAVCTEQLTRNHMVSDPHVLATYDVDITDPTRVLFQCPNCDHVTSRGSGEAD